MKIFTTRLARLLWVGALVLFIAVWLYPVSSKVTRAGGLALFSSVWAGGIFLVWRWRHVRFGLLGFTALCAIFLMLPRRHEDTGSLRSYYVAGLRRYEGVNYYWGGESPKGIDCSGLIRRGLIDSLFLQGVRTLDGGLVRDAISLWWNDCTAASLGKEGALTSRLFAASSINALDHSKLLPGDLAVTSTGVHVLAYIGENRWIEADPGIGRVTIVPVPTADNPWFKTGVNIVRWKMFQQ